MMRDEVRSTVEFEAVRESTVAKNNITELIELKNSSDNDVMVAPTLVYEQQAGHTQEQQLSQKLDPDGKIRLAPPAFTATVIRCHFRWTFDGLPVSSPIQQANPGNFYVSVSASLRPDGSGGAFMTVQRPAR